MLYPLSHIRSGTWRIPTHLDHPVYGLEGGLHSLNPDQIEAHFGSAPMAPLLLALQRLPVQEGTPPWLTWTLPSTEWVLGETTGTGADALSVALWGVDFKAAMKKAMAETPPFRRITASRRAARARIEAAQEDQRRAQVEAQRAEVARQQDRALLSTITRDRAARIEARDLAYRGVQPGPGEWIVIVFGSALHAPLQARDVDILYAGDIDPARVRELAQAKAGSMGLGHLPLDIHKVTLKHPKWITLDTADPGESWDLVAQSGGGRVRALHEHTRGADTHGGVADWTVYQRTQQTLQAAIRRAARFDTPVQPPAGGYRIMVPPPGMDAARGDLYCGEVSGIAALRGAIAKLPNGAWQLQQAVPPGHWRVLSCLLAGGYSAAAWAAWHAATGGDCIDAALDFLFDPPRVKPTHGQPI